MVNLSIFKKNFINFLSPINSQIDDVLRHCSGTNIIHDISLLEDFSKRYPNNPKLLYNLSYLFGANNEMQKARDFYNRAFALDERFLDNIFVKIAPGYIQIETVRGCNAACVMCPLENSSTQKRAMKDDVFNKITSEIQKIPHYDPQIALYGLSEPLVDKKLIPRIRRLKKIGISNITLQSNGALFDSQKAKDIIDAGISGIGFSLESIQKDQYEKIRKGLKFSDTISGIESFIMIRDRQAKTLPINISFTYDENNRNEYAEFREFWMKRLNKETDKILLAPMHSFNEFQTYSEVSDFPCYQIYTDMHIRADGMISLCCIDVESEYGIGNINDSDLLSIYNCEQIKVDRHRHFIGNRKSMGICKKCDQPEAAAKTCVDDLGDLIPTIKGNYFEVLH